MELFTQEDLMNFVKKRPTALRKAIRRGHLPKPILVGGSNRWIREEVEAALLARQAARDAS